MTLLSCSGSVDPPMYNDQTRQITQQVMSGCSALDSIQIVEMYLQQCIRLMIR